MRTDPSETGGLFVGRRPGTAPVRYRAAPVLGSATRRRVDGWLAGWLLATMTFLCLLCWGPLPLLCLWVGSQVDYISGSVMFGIVTAFMTLLGVLLALLAALTRLDRAWILVRRAAGHDQRTGMLGRIFAITAAIGATGFLLWFLVIHGPGPSLFSSPSGG
jgi:hypothetical protein